MRRVSRPIVLGGALLVLCLFTAPAAVADTIVDPPQAKISPPAGIAAPTEPEDTVRVSPPGGVEQIRILKPSGAPRSKPTFFDLFWMWLQAQAKIGPPAG